MVLNRKITGAMREQLDRVNEHPPTSSAALIDKIVKLEEEVKRLRAELARTRQQTDQHHAPDVLIYGGQPFFTLNQAAKKAGVSYWKAYRIVQDGHWRHEINESGHYLVCADQPLTVPPRKKNTRRKN